MSEYKLVRRTCVNSHWVAKFLLVSGEEGCQCPFGCKVTVRNLEDTYNYVVSEEEYNEIFEDLILKHTKDDKEFIFGATQAFILIGVILFSWCLMRLSDERRLCEAKDQTYLITYNKCI